MPPILFIALLSLAADLRPSDGAPTERVIDGLRFVLVDPPVAGRQDSKLYRVRLVGDRDDAGTLTVICDRKEIVGASFEPRKAVAGDGIARAADKRLCD